MRYFDYSFLEHGLLPAGLVNMAGAIAELRERERTLKTNYSDVFTRLESIAKVQSVKGSNEIEGIVTSEKELDKRFALVNSTKVTKRQRIEATVLNSLLPIGKSEICCILPDVSPTTVEAVISAMVKSGVIEKIGAARNTKYVKRQ
jgi:predicted HTH transcriptional regulator